jgi:hypothetical protein
MGRPLKIQKTNAMAGIFYDNTSQGTVAQSVNVDEGYPPFAAPTSMDTSTVVLPTPGTTPPIPFTGVVGGAPVLSSPSTSYPVVKCQVNIALPSGSGFGAHNGRILRQKGVRKFMVVDGTTINDEDLVAGATYMILSAGSTNWGLFGCPANTVVNGVNQYAAGQIFTATTNGSNSGNGTALLVGTCVLSNNGTPTVGNMAISVSIADSTPTYLSKLTNKFAQDFNGGEAGGSANTGNVWAEDEVVNNIEYAANFFIDGEQFAKSGADVATWASTQQNSNGTLTMAEVENYTS